MLRLRSSCLAAALLAAAVLVVQPAAPRPAQAATGYDGITLLNSSMWGPDNQGLKYVVGEVRNDTSATIQTFQWLLEFKDSQGKVINTNQGGFGGDWHRLAPGEKAPVMMFAPSGAASYTVVAMSADTTTTPANRNFSYTVEGEKPDYFDSNYRWFSGTVTNLNDVPAQNVYVVASFYSAGIVDTDTFWVGWDNGNKTLAPGETRGFYILRHISRPHFGSAGILVDAESTPGNRIPPPPPTTTTSTTRPPATQTTTTTTVPSATPISQLLTDQATAPEGGDPKAPVTSTTRKTSTTTRPRGTTGTTAGAPSSTTMMTSPPEAPTHASEEDQTTSTKDTPPSSPTEAAAARPSKGSGGKGATLVLLGLLAAGVVGGGLVWRFRSRRLNASS